MGIPSGTPKILGKTIIGIIHKENCQRTTPAAQVFILFSDNTYYEFYSFSEIFGTKGVNKGGIKEVRNYMAEGMKVVFEALSE